MTDVALKERDPSDVQVGPVDEAARLAREISESRAAESSQETQADYVKRLDQTYGELPAEEFLDVMINQEFSGRIALVSSFGAEAAVLLDLVSRVAPDLPVVFLETGMHFAQTLQYRRQVAEKLGLTNVLDIMPDAEDLKAEDPDNTLWQWDTDKCCNIRKVRPLAKALEPFDAWINGRKQMHGGERVRLPRVEVNGKFIKVNPLARWTRDDVQHAFEESGLPRHPLVEQGYPSIGCWPCTQPASEDDIRSGRWSGSDKTECGIHGKLGM